MKLKMKNKLLRIRGIALILIVFILTLPACDYSKPVNGYITIGGRKISVETTELYLQDVRDITALKHLTELIFLEIDMTLTIGPFVKRITDISPLAPLIKLKVLHLNGHMISNLEPLAQLANLTELHLIQNRISDITPLAHLVSLTTLNLSANTGSERINISPLSKLINLKNLDLSNNKIREWGDGYEHMRYDTIESLATLTNLVELNLSNTGIEDIAPLSALVNLTKLDLTGNLISDVTPLMSLTHLENLRLPKLSQEQLDELQAALPNCIIE